MSLVVKSVNIERVLGNKQEVMLFRAARPWYSRPQRKYHTWKHALEVVDALMNMHFTAESGLFHVKELVIAAAWHDAVYVPGFKHNEEASAAAFHNHTACLPHVFVDLDLEQIKELIRYTQLQYHMAVNEQDIPVRMRPLLDADIAGMAAPYRVFVANQRHIAYEQNRFAVHAVAMENVALWLKNFSGLRPWLFHTDFGKEHFENAARSNIQRFCEEYGDGY